MIEGCRLKNEMVKSVKSRFAGIEDNALLSVATIVTLGLKISFFLFQATYQKNMAKEATQEEVRKVRRPSNSEVITLSERSGWKL